MNKLLTLLVLAVTLISFNSNSFAAKQGAEAANAAEQGQLTTEQVKDEEKKKVADEEEPECD